jgi:hypothetical protein
MHERGGKGMGGSLQHNASNFTGMANDDNLQRAINMERNHQHIQA